MVSRLLGMVRDMLMAAFFGTSLYMSAFAVAFTIPNLFRRLFGEGALSAAFIPVFVETRKQEGGAAAWVLARQVISLTAAVLLAVVALGWALLVILLGVYGDRFGPVALVTIDLLRILLPYVLFVCLMALSMGILNSLHRFALPAITPALLNVIWIVALLTFCPLLVDPLSRVRVVAWAILAGGILQLGIQVPLLWKLGWRPGWDPNPASPRVRRITKLMGPAALGMAVTQVNVMIDRLLAAGIGPWAPAALWFSERLIYLPLGLFATALGTVLLPVFSGQAADRDTAAVRNTVRGSLCHLLYIMLPASAGLFVLSGPIVRLIYGWGAFQESSVWFTAVALQCYAFGLVVFSLAKVFVPVFYAHQDTRTPVIVGLVTVGVKLTLSITFILTLPLAVKHAGLASATVLAESFAAVVLAVILHRRYGSPGWGRIAFSAARSLGLAAVAAATAWWAHPVLQQLTGAWPEKFSQAASVLGAIALAVGVYLVVSVILRIPEARDILQALRQRASRRAGAAD